ncbi:hypothetical protein HYT25_00420 [Candidatus Pacearchaeota archaeon]|nr:hypothetical protein [Candidatus Pacearchaeota archaeon]
MGDSSEISMLMVNLKDVRHPFVNKFLEKKVRELTCKKVRRSLQRLFPGSEYARQIFAHPQGEYDATVFFNKGRLYGFLLEENTNSMITFTPFINGKDSENAIPSIKINVRAIPATYRKIDRYVSPQIKSFFDSLKLESTSLNGNNKNNFRVNRIKSSKRGGIQLHDYTSYMAHYGELPIGAVIERYYEGRLHFNAFKNLRSLENPRMTNLESLDKTLESHF